MAGVNKVILVGRLGKDPEVRTFEDGTKLATFSVATSESWKDKVTGEKKEQTEWHNILIWGALADVAGKYLHKGDLVYLEGKMRTRSWEKDGITRYTTSVHVDNMMMLGSANRNAAPSHQSQPNQSAPSAPASQNYQTAPVSSGSFYPTDDLPF